MKRFNVLLLAISAVLLLKSWPVYKFLLDLTALNRFIVAYRIGPYLLSAASITCIVALAASYEARLRRERG